MKNYEGTVLQSLLTVPVNFVWLFLLVWIAAITGLIYLAIII